MIDMQSPDESAGKPKLRAACDSCRQSKVRCSGGRVCVRCEKHEFKCVYSIASRAGKPKGSKNKATLKKLENIQAVKRNTSPRTKMSTWTTPPKVPSDPNYLCLRDRRKGLSTTRFDMGWPSQGQPSDQPHEPFRKYSLPGREIVCPSPISPAFRSYTWGGPLSIDLDSYGSVDTPYLLSPANSQYIHSPVGESANLLNIPPEPPTPVDICCCIQRQAMSQSQLYHLGPDSSRWLFDPTIEAVYSSLSSCQMIFNCAVCSKDTNRLTAAVGLLDRLFSVFAQIVFQTLPHNLPDTGAWCDPYSIPQEYTQEFAPAARKSLVERTLKRAHKTLDLLRRHLDSGFDMRTADFAFCSTFDVTDKPYTNQVFGDNRTHFAQPGNQLPTPPLLATPLFDKGKLSNGFNSGDIGFLRQAISHYESILDNIRASPSYNATNGPSSSSQSTFGFFPPWFPNVPGASDPQQLQYQASPAQPFQNTREPSSYGRIGVS
ncbi:hypothetical protein BGW36DRAFT_361026 [Talaromyces proteolyticus]|uniref:Zn(2)-C6 fungal-type domain-containing protein n=1 Tax=Talaromyces proteolyticus TaxID=1131652 RepID=A0AAD4KMH1_9EURO|nr:uncharacterized protein BGW36DRAFT_361026 [Talaromyces proteolyticus]KAH8695325.1 hypothetical protein BGW36DRAFT_361026 [Talaromyces proteolyticus]